jgi:hypothetical protein
VISRSIRKPINSGKIRTGIDHRQGLGVNDGREIVER